MRRAAVCICVFLLISSVVPALAGDRVGLGVKAGTLGLGVDVTGRFTNWLSVRGTYNKADLSRSEEVSDVDYDGDVALGAYGLLLDFHPFKGNFRISAGYLKNRTGVDMDAEPTVDTEIGDTVYTPAEIGTISGELDFDDKVPYFGLGYGSAAKGPNRVRFVLDVGVLSQGSGDVTLSNSTGLVDPDDLRQEEENAEDDIKDYDLWPVLAFGISFRL
jgi:hypothetical protein